MSTGWDGYEAGVNATISALAGFITFGVGIDIAYSCLVACPFVAVMVMLSLVGIALNMLLSDGRRYSVPPAIKL